MVLLRPDAASVAALRAVSFRIANTPTERLPHVAPQIAAGIWSCRNLLALSVDPKGSGDVSVLVHRLNTQISSLLQDRSVPGRWAAVVIVKAVLEAGELEALNKCNAWVRSLLSILKRPDPPSTRCLTVIVLTRIFMLTWGHANLVREITTPALPAFVSTCLNNIENGRCSPNELQTILDAFSALLARHNTIFRSHEPAIRALLVRILSCSPSAADQSVHYTEGHRSIALHLFVLLHGCAPKQTSSEKWAETVDAALASAHAVCDQIFRAFQEKWKSSTGVQPSSSSNKLLSSDVSVEASDRLGLRAWRGIDAGSERLVVLLALLRLHVETSTPFTVALRPGLLVDLLLRILSVTLPLPEKPDQLKANHEISREERERLLAVIPIIHVEALELTQVLILRLCHSGTAMQKILLDMALWIFSAEQAYEDIRRAIYRASSAALNVIGSAITREDVADQALLLKTACADLLMDLGQGSVNIMTGLLGSERQNSEATRDTARGNTGLSCTGLKHAAAHLIQSTLENVPAVFIAPKIRAQMDRAAVLSQDKDLLLASVLNPPVRSGDEQYQPSLLPILARQHPRDTSVEALLRPRLPALHGSTLTKTYVNNNDWHADDEIEEEQYIEEIENTPSLLNPLAQPSSNISTAKTPEETRASTVLNSQQPKRPAEEVLASGLTIKRAKSAEDVDNLVSESRPAALHAELVVTDHGSQKATPDADHRESVSNHGEDRASITLVQFHDIQSASTAAGANNPDESEDDASDFEMPPLTMEPDTDSEAGDAGI